MRFFESISKPTVSLVIAAGLLSSCFHKKYETPIAKNTQQPDKVLFDQAVKDIEHGRYEVARISLQTLMNTYESSEYLAKAKLAIADSWYREGGGSGMAQAEAEYKDFILFYPNMEESAEAQNRVCMIHYRQMEKSDRDWSQTLRAEDECRLLLTQFPNSKFAPQAQQRLRNVQESLADHEFVVGTFYFKRDMNPAAANRLNALVDQYPLYSKADEALYEAGGAYSKMGPHFRQRAGDMYSRIVRDYPLSARADDAKSALEDMEMPVPKADRAAYDREKFELENYKKPGMVSRSTGFLKAGPDVAHAAKSGAPTMTDPKVTIPGSVPVMAPPVDVTPTTAAGQGSTEVTASQVGGNSALDTKPDARSTAAKTEAAAAPAPDQPLPTNRDAEIKKQRALIAKKQAKLEKKKKKDTGNPAAAQQQGQSQLNQSQASQGAQTPVGTPNAVGSAPAANPPAAATPPPPQP